MRQYLKKPVLILSLLIIIAVVMNPVGNLLSNHYSQQKAADIAAFNIGDTVTSGTYVVDNSKIRKVPVISHPEYLIYDIKEHEFYDFFTALTTGAVETPIEQVTGSRISKYGVAQGFNGPGVLAVTNNKLVVNPPETFVWGFKIPYTYAVKTNSGIEIQEGSETVKVVSSNDISNDTVPHNYVTVKTLKKWYNESVVGDKIAIDYALGNFSDGRNIVTPDEIKTFFGASVLSYMENYPSYAPVLVYSTSSNQNVSGTGSSVLGSYTQYSTTVREFNALEFVKGWNGTIIPAHTSATGKANIAFQGIFDENDTYGQYATHGVCPPGRALRAAVLSAGFALPSGMTDVYDSVEYSSNPTTGIIVNNTGDYPILITMWTSGSGASMQIYANIKTLLP